jgi:PIN domain nuclease of toxin-antitoxin system
MIVLDTHIWVWWTHSPESLSQAQRELIEASETDLIGVSAISCWEIAKLVERGRLELPVALEDWFDQALNYPGIQLLALSPEIAIESTRLPGDFHRDPADQIIVATARVYDCPLVTADEKILNYEYVIKLR